MSRAMVVAPLRMHQNKRGVVMERGLVRTRGGREKINYQQSVRDFFPREEAKKCQKGGEGSGVDSAALLFNNQSGSLAELRKLVLAEKQKYTSKTFNSRQRSLRILAPKTISIQSCPIGTLARKFMLRLSQTKVKAKQLSFYRSNLLD